MFFYSDKSAKRGDDLDALIDGVNQRSFLPKLAECPEKHRDYEKQIDILIQERRSKEEQQVDSLFRYVQHHVFKNDWYKTRLQYRKHFDIEHDRRMTFENLRSVQLLSSGPDGNPSGEEASKNNIRKDADRLWKVYCFTEGRPLASELFLRFMENIGDTETQGNNVLLVPRPEDTSEEPPKLSYGKIFDKIRVEDRASQQRERSTSRTLTEINAGIDAVPLLRYQPTADEVMVQL